MNHTHHIDMPTGYYEVNLLNEFRAAINKYQLDQALILKSARDEFLLGEVRKRKSYDSRPSINELDVVILDDDFIEN